MKKMIGATMFALGVSLIGFADEPVMVASPNGNVVMSLRVDGGSLTYSLQFKNR